MASISTKKGGKAPTQKYANGRWAKAISDRSGLEFPYNEMVKEWTGALVHTSEWEEKQPQLDPIVYTDATALKNPRPPVNMFTGNIPEPTGVPNQITNVFPGTFGATGISFPMSTGEQINANIGNVTVVIS
jgi:hypothetical protein|tara:strand:+ start:15878 stop:16270 length:393 start_codon:yes stop_codon:yes gene_type:complete